ncbi:hypothetical protein J6590_077603 [Homalodisca vitripennis]|nr:hypothetical protein J6590_077603 [Homalodisca vitripennis]
MIREEDVCSSPQARGTGLWLRESCGNVADNVIDDFTKVVYSVRGGCINEDCQQGISQAMFVLHHQLQ